MQVKPERRFFVIWWWNKGQSWLRLRPNALHSFTIGKEWCGPHASRAEAESARVAFGLHCRATQSRGRGARWWQKHTRVVGYTLEELTLGELAGIE